MPRTESIIKAYPKQEEFISAMLSGKYNTGIYGGAMGGGKSYTCCIILILLCRFFPGSKWIIVRESRPSLEKTILPTFNKIFPNHLLKSFNHSKLIAFFKNGSQIHFMEESIERDRELDRFKGVECNGFFFEQIEEISEKLFEMSYIRSIPGRWVIPGDKQPPQLILASCNPADNWIKTRFYDKFREGKLPPRTFYIEAKIFDNEEIMKSGQVDEIFSNLDELTVRMFRDGDWDAFKNEDSFLYAFDKKRHISDAITAFDDTPILLCFDFNVEPFSCVVMQKDTEWLWILDEIQIDHTQGDDLLKTMCKRIKDDYPGAGFIVCGDASGRQRSLQSNRNAYDLIQKYLNLTDHQIQVRRRNLGLKESRMLCNSVFTHFQVKIHPRCKTLTRECKIAKFINGELIKDRKEKKLDCFDAMRYGIDWGFENFIEFLNLQT